MPDESWEKVEDYEFFDFLSYDYSHHSHTAYEQNQVITFISNISDSIGRTFENEAIWGTKAYHIVFKIPRTVCRNARIGTKRVIRHYEDEYRIQQQSN